MLERALQKAILSFRLSVCHTRDPYLNGSKYQNIFYTYDRAIFLFSWGQIL